MIEHLKSLGGSPFISGSSWNSSNYSLKKLFNEEPFHATVLLLNHELQPCLVKSDDSDKIMPCFLFRLYRDTFDRGGLNDTVDMLVKLRQSIPSSEKKKLIFEAQRAAQLRIEFYKLKVCAPFFNKNLHFLLNRVCSKMLYTKTSNGTPLEWFEYKK